MDNVKAFVAILTKVEDRLENIHSIIKRIERKLDMTTGGEYEN